MKKHSKKTQDILSIVIILCSIPNNGQSNPFSIAKTLIKKKLAACVTILPYTNSIYSWNNEIQQQKETQLLIKTCTKLEKSIFEYIKIIHPYNIPELLTFTVTNGEWNYLSWIYNTLNTTP